MSQENVDVVRRTLEAGQRDDLEVFMSGIHPAMEWHAVLESLVEGPQSLYRGHDGVRRLWHNYRTDLDAFEVEAEEIRDGHNGPGPQNVPLARLPQPRARPRSRGAAGVGHDEFANPS